jgi:hypothetical protein
MTGKKYSHTHPPTHIIENFGSIIEKLIFNEARMLSQEPNEKVKLCQAKKRLKTLFTMICFAV